MGVVAELAARPLLYRGKIAADAATAFATLDMPDQTPSAVAAAMPTRTTILRVVGIPCPCGSTSTSQRTRPRM